MAKIPYSSDEQDRVTEMRDAAPIHYTFTIQSFSLLSKTFERYDSGTFQAGGYKWKLCLFPNGNKNKDVKDHISLYLIMADTSSLPPGSEVNAVFRLFLFDRIRDKYLTLEDGKVTGRRFHEMKIEWGFDQFIALKTFNEPSNGYLIDDVCVFGAEVFVCKESSGGNGERLSMNKGATATKYIWKIENFSKVYKECIKSEAFTIGDHKWKVKFDPLAFVEGKEWFVSMFLVLSDSTMLPPSRKVYADYTLRVINQENKEKFFYGKASNWFSASSESHGWQKFMNFNNLYQPGYIAKDTCTIEAEITILGVANRLP